MAKATKRGKSWQVRVYDYTDEKGVKHNRSFTAKTKAQAELMAAEFVREKSVRTGIAPDITVGEAIDKYIALKPTLSPTTLTAYERMRKFAFQDIMDLPVKKLTDLRLQEAVNRECRRVSERTGKVISVKTVKNEYALLASALKVICKRSYVIGKIEGQKHIKDYPEIEEVLSLIVGSDIELPCMLALWLTFTMSEIRGLKCSDIKGGFITINRVVVDTKNETLVKDTAKTQTRLRKHEIPPYIMGLIENTATYQEYVRTGKDSFLVEGDRDRIYKHWKAMCREIGYGELTFHDLRHLSASLMLYLGIPEKYAMERGGWKTPSVMVSVYQHTLSAERRYFDGVVNEWFAQKLHSCTTPSAETPCNFKVRNLEVRGSIPLCSTKDEKTTE